jgi:hypothetical protein
MEEHMQSMQFHQESVAVYDRKQRLQKHLVRKFVRQVHFALMRLLWIKSIHMKWRLSSLMI